MIKIDKNILSNTPEYEEYTENEAVLTKEEMKELGIEPKKKTYVLGGGCGCGGGCCKNK